MPALGRMNGAWRLTLTPLVEVDLLQMSDNYVQLVVVVAVAPVGSSSKHDSCREQSRVAGAANLVWLAETWFGVRSVAYKSISCGRRTLE